MRNRPDFPHLRQCCLGLDRTAYPDRCPRGSIRSAYGTASSANSSPVHPMIKLGSPSVIQPLTASPPGRRMLVYDDVSLVHSTLHGAASSLAGIISYIPLVCVGYISR